MLDILYLEIFNVLNSKSNIWFFLCVGHHSMTWFSVLHFDRKLKRNLRRNQANAEIIQWVFIMEEVATGNRETPLVL